MKIAVLGAGAMGQVTIFDLVESSGVSEVLIADLNLDRAEELKAQLKSSKIKTAKADVQNVEALASLLSSWDAVVNCSPYVFNLNVMEAALKAGCHYLDLGGLFHVINIGYTVVRWRARPFMSGYGGIERARAQRDSGAF